MRRSGRLTLGQKMGLTDFWKDYGVDLPKGKIDLNALFIKRQEVSKWSNMRPTSRSDVQLSM